MSKPFASGVGAPLSADIAVPDHARAVRFYSRVLPTGDRPLWRAEDLMNNFGVPIIGLGAQSPEHAHLPVQWMPHIQVADVAASVQRALERGGSELLHARDDERRSQWAVLRDPNGAAFGLVPVVPAEAIPAVQVEGPIGRIAWLDLTVPDAEATRDFYCDVVGWSWSPVEMKDGEEKYADYNLLLEDGTPAAGACHARGANAGLPGVWMLYLPVGDLDESLRRVEQEGGAVVKAYRNKQGACVYAAVQDPAGAHVALVPA